MSQTSTPYARHAQLFCPNRDGSSCWRCHEQSVVGDGAFYECDIREAFFWAESGRRCVRRGVRAGPLRAPVPEAVQEQVGLATGRRARVRTVSHSRNGGIRGRSAADWTGAAVNMLENEIRVGRAAQRVLCRDWVEIPIPCGKPGKAGLENEKTSLKSRTSYARDTKQQTL